jgi:hypothetical protein
LRCQQGGTSPTKFDLTRSTSLPIQYPLLSEADAFSTRGLLEQIHEHFYHFTLDDHIESIKKTGLDPGFEGEDSRYANRDREPANAIRYCTSNVLSLGLNAAATRNQVWSPKHDMWLPRPPERIVLLRARTSALLSRSFGLDHSHAEVSRAADALLADTERLTADEFVAIVAKYGDISCYEAIPADELELCVNIENFCIGLQGEFSPLR